MADEAAVSAPVTSVPVATSVATPAPIVATPAAVPATTAAVVPPTSASELTATGSAQVTVPTTPNDGETTAAFLARVIEAKNNGAKDSAAVVDDEVDEVDGEPVLTGDGTEEAVVDDPSAEREDDYDPFEATPGPLSPKDLNSKIQASPELKAALAADPELQNSIFAASRLAAEAASFKAVFTNAEEAAVASRGNAEFATLSDLVTSIEKPEDASAFYGRLMQLSILLDEEGKPILDDGGKPRSDGTVGNLIHHTGALFLNHFGREAETKNDPELAAAVDVLRARAFGGSAPTDNEDFTEEQQAREEALKAGEAALANEKSTAHQTRVKDFNARVTSGIDLSTNTRIAELLARTDVPEEDRSGLANTIRESLYNLIVANSSFKGEQDELMRRPMGDKTSAARIGLGKRYVDSIFTTVAGAAIAKHGAKIMGRQAKQQSAQAARVEASRSEASGSLRTSKPSIPASAAQAATAATAALTQKLGRTPSFAETLTEINRTRAGQ